MFASRRIFNLVLALTLAGFGVAGYIALGPPAAAKPVTATATVSKGSVLSSVSATGNASAATQLSLSFQTSGTVTEVDVTPGQAVTAGQVLAKITNATQQDALTSAKAGLASAQAKMLQDQTGETPQQRAVDAAGVQTAQNSVTNAIAGVDTAQANAAQNAAQQATSVQEAEQNLATAQATAALDTKQQATAVDQAQQNVANAQANANQDATTQQNAVNQAQAQLATDNQTYQNDQSRPVCSTTSPSTTSTSSTTQPPSNCVTQSQLDADKAKVAQDQNQVTNALNSQQASALKDSQGITAAQNGVTNAQNSQTAAALKDAQSIQNAQNAITASRTAQQAAQLKDQQAIQNAEQQVASAQLSQETTAANNAVKQAPATAATVAADQAQVDSAQAQLNTAQNNYNQTILTAPVGGTVSLINGQVGQQASSSSSSSSSGSGSGSSSSSTSAAGSAGSGFITLTNLQTLQVVAGFSETDAAKIQLGQPATVTFNALPNQNLQGKVSQIDINSQVVSNVVTYNVTVSILNPPAALKPGMTANVSVTTAQRDGVLTLPTSAITGNGSTTTLQVQAANGKPVAHVVTIGLRGDTNDEITSGLSAGDKIVITRASSTGTGTGNVRLPTGAGGVGGLVTGGGGGGGGGGVRVGG